MTLASPPAARPDLQQPRPGPAPGACVCYAIDEGYLLPALVSARQARQQTSARLADVVIVCIGEPSRTLAAATAAAEAVGVKLLRISTREIDDMHPIFGRYFLSDVLPATYSRIVYIDGDTQIRGRLDPLFEVAIPAGGFLACRDPGVLFEQRDPVLRKRVRGQRERMGLAVAPENYFNSGVLVLERAAWREIGRDTVAMYRDRRDRLAIPDQDALNLAAGHRCTLIPNRWNFPGFLIGSPAEAEARPRIYHFMSNPRPWMIAAQPWGEAWRAPYREFLDAFPELEHLRPRPSRAYAARYHLRQLVGMQLTYRAVGRMREAPPQLAI
jgi:lipopolysaccharide biosynthesis glycosyltransferase